MIPSVKITKADYATGSVSPSATGILAIIASTVKGTENQAASYARDDLAVTDFGGGPAVEYLSYDIQVSGNPAVIVKPTTAIAGAYSAITSTPGTGTSVVTADGVSLPVDEYSPLLTIVNGGTVGVSGVTYTTSLDGGASTSAVTALGTANTVTIGTSGVKFDLGAGTLLAGATFSAFCTRPQSNNTDLVAALEALRVTRLPWEGVLIDCAYTGSVGVIDTWLSGLEAFGQFHFAMVNTRHKNTPVPATETEAAYLAAMTTATSGDSSIRVCVGTDAADLTSTITGVSQPRPTSLFLAARAMSIDPGEDPAYIGRGNIPGAKITDNNGNPRWHDEDLYPGLDAQRLVTLRSFSPGGPSGVYVCNANVISPNGSDYVWLQHVRTMNLACGIAWQVVSGQLSKGVGKKAPDPNSGAVYIQEKDAQAIDGLVNVAFLQPMKGQVTAVLFRLSRADDLSSNSSSTVHGTVQIESLAYLKKFSIQTSFAKSIQVGL